MNVFETRDTLVSDYTSFVTSYINIRTRLKWDEGRRAILRAELDAYYAKLYGITEEELRYILGPKDVYGEDFASETFRVLKDKETRLYKEYRTKRLILEAWKYLNNNGTRSRYGG